jgi:hypothetical protein
MINYEKSILPKLLAKENITIRHGNFKTAWFDIKNRTLGLPLWKDMGKDVYDLLIGHEVGHALETPFEGWHDSPEKLEGCPRSYINVIEDARIERKVQSRYPGLVNSFNKGYKKLLDNEFFGPLDDVDYDQVKLIDKINLKTKLGSLIEVPFNSEEMVFLERAKTTQTFGEVVELVKDILAFTQSNTPELIQKPEPDTTEDQNQDTEDNQDVDPTSSGHDDYMEQENEKEKTKNSSADPSTEENDEESEEETKTVASLSPEHTDGDISITDEIFRAKEKSLVDQDDRGNETLVISQISKENIQKSLVDFKTLSKQRNDCAAKLEKEAKEYNVSYMTEYKEKLDDYPSYMKQLKKNVQPAVREFEMKKAATQWQRATEAKTGNINVNKLWSYKTNDDIFLKATKLPKAKSHGMVMLVDYSGSMSSSMRYVMDQILHTIVFCKSVNIPFEVYAFTTGGWSASHIERDYLPGDLDMDDLRMPLLVSSEMKKADYIEATKYLFLRTIPDIHNHMPVGYSESWGSTPLNQSLIVCHDVVKKFRAKHNIEKLNFLTFTDGDANRISIHGNDYYKYSDDMKLIVQGKTVKATRGRNNNLTKALLNNLKKMYNTNNIGFFMAEGSEWKYRLNDIAWYENNDIDDVEFRKTCNREYSKNKCVEFKKIKGYDTYYMVKGGKTLDTKEEEFEVEDHMSDAQIRTAFKKFSKTKKTNKVLLTKFGGAVA